MGRTGPVPMPDNVRVLRGSEPLRRDGQRVRRLVLAPKAPTAPAGLGRAAAAEWRRVTRELGHAGVLAEVDRAVLTAYVDAWGFMQEAAAILRSEKLVRPNREGVNVKNPAWQVWREAQHSMLMAAKELYLTPVARLRIPIAPGAAGIDGSSDGGDAFD